MTQRFVLIAALVGFASGCSGLVAGPEGGNGPGGSDGPGGTDKPGKTPIPVGKDGEPGIVDCDGKPVATGETRIFRLTERQYENTVRELMGLDTLDVTLTDDEEEAPSALAVQKWNQTAADLVPAQAPWMNGYVTCTLGTNNTACAKEFLTAFATRAFRRALTADEQNWLDATWAAMPADGTQSEKLAALVQSILQAPQFIYLYPVGEVVPGAEDGPLRLTGEEMAARLSYFFWDTLPDDELLAAAGDGSLDTPEGVSAQAERMLADDRAKPVLRGYLTNWLDLEGTHTLGPVDSITKDTTIFPDFTAATGRDMRTEIEAFMDYVMFEKGGSFESLFLDTRAYVNGPLAKLYGVTDGPAGANQWAWVDLNSTQRAGILTRASYLAVHASATNSSPIRRGVHVLSSMLCQPPGAPPGNVDNTPVSAGTGSTGKLLSVREQTELRTQAPECAGCHSRINPIGFAFEHYDAMGGWQGDTETNSGADVNAVGELHNAGLASGPVDGAVALSERLLETDWMRECATEQWFDHALRRNPGSLDVCSLQTVRQQVGKPGSLTTLLLRFVESDAFRYVNHGN